MTNRSFILPVVVAVFCPLFSRAFVTAGEECSTSLRVTKNAGGYEFLDGDKPVLFYQAKTKSLDGKFERAGYVHPLYNLDGDAITEDFPTDHLHHRGIFWAWHQLYVGDTQIGDPWTCRNFLSRVDEVAIEESSADAAAILATAHWISSDWTDDSGTPKPIVREQTRIEVFRKKEGSRVIDFRIALTALEAEVRIGGSDDIKGYGGFSPRLRLPKDILFTAEYGVVEPQKTAVDASPWMDISGTFGETNKDEKSATSGIVVLCHPSLPGFPQKWILRKARSMQNPVFPGRTPVELPAKKPLELRYRLIIHHGAVSKDQLTGWFNKYASEE